MLIYLVPADQTHPRVYHTIDFKDTFDRVPMPVAWSTQLHSLHMDEIDLPTTTHALDKACWLTAVIEELVFDMVSRTVSVSLVNGPTMQWPLAKQSACMDVLMDVLDDLNESKIAQNKERIAASPKPEPLALPQPVSAKPAKHKKQRSLLSSLISGLNKLGNSSPSRTTFSPPPSPPSRPSTISWKPTASFLPLSKKMPMPKPPVRPLSAVLQDRARSTLVDAFRRFVIAEVKSRLPLGGYALWAAQRMLRQTEEHMACLVQEAGGAVPDLMRMLPPRRMRASDLSGSTLVSVEEASCYDDDEEEEEEHSLADSASTETDGSSIHTPVDCPGASPFARAPRTQASTEPFPRSPSPPEFSAADLAAYTALSAQCLRLRQLIARMDDAREDREQNDAGMQAVLEVKSRRRAWSNRALLGGAPASGVGLALPFRSSPLARCEPITPDFVHRPLLEVSTGEHNLSTLFPVSEEDEEEEEKEEALPPRLVPQTAMKDADCVLPLQRPAMRPRTHSMHPAYDMDIHPTPMVIPPPPLQALPSTALLYQPVKPALESQARLDLFDHPEHAGDDFDDVELGNEFTLSMDAPPPYLKADMDEDGWIEHTDPIR
ncbi:hypothetical protein WOLCODRAFT_140849 [Wolfiporia cocos MD-104 SS10]|uniref:Uncharacterized protein n=1 Tax=Wolfiporia cocos (strain MD-104) TaxID=742152 RepID=A0A2H3JN46_WOLCO|nr:hypothetical protein WOLCODRAFT_140849 [Wolfiporia cocos MD-104 SS10]